MSIIPTAIETGPDRLFDYARPYRHDISFPEVARSLSYTVRFRGFVKHFYSVAQHALLVRSLVLHMGCPELALAALHHDTHEAFMGDIPTPMKAWMDGKHVPLEHAINAVVADALSITQSDFSSPVIKEADERALRIEAAVLKHSKGVSGNWSYEELPEIPPDWQPEEDMDRVRERFLRAHHYEMRRHGAE